MLQTYTSNVHAPLDGLNLNLLVSLDALLSWASVSRAAEVLGTTQPTVSRSLATLRKTFDDPLLVRSGRGLALTPLGASLREPVERLLREVDRLRWVGSFDPERDARTFRLVVPDVVGLTLVPALLARVAQTDNLSVLVVSSERFAMQDLLRGAVDLVVGAPKLEHSELYSRHVGPELGWSVISGPTHPAEDAMTLEAWLGSDHVQLVPEGRPESPSEVDQLLKTLGLHRRVRAHLDNLSAIARTVHATPMVASLPTPAARILAKAHGLRLHEHPLGDRIPNLRLRLTWWGSQHADLGHRWLRSVASTAIDETYSAKQSPP